ncbi:exopolyphosphatase/guanosine-5'-triphosphate,3'-diphosphate pyrophosphatase [Oikeobacillus pervagus]|uniref:Exopolyphosphatase/guanosine-5'-triphosphate, 3'-diphosphate pyrophosphatase n=1 Tax=Oikeobacillus pervagus TaxID=1325931 RepID=A0AAJ1T1B4_9BACI|nr:Ppx/GppA family phosphatase [Oikeobacillus pervagus]MDQ0214826.1 exopolyphosphatase/guanosine-5'-triphosphate,3'-diphosphate pyrophosphatase [Oikeobacillus pervagus]
MKKYKKYAVIDIGSNTIRLVVYSLRKTNIHELENVKVPSRLRNFLGKDLYLNELGMDHLLSVLTSFKEIILFHEVEEVVCIATATIRQAMNREEIVKRIHQLTKFEVEILSGQEEAYYGLSAVLKTLPVNSGITIDIGGGSTEITYFEDRQLKNSHSFPFGVVSLKQQFIKGNQMTSEELQKIGQYIIQQFETLPWLKNKQLPIITIGGSARNLAQIDQQKRDYPLSIVHQYEMSRQEYGHLREQLLPLNYEQLEKVDGLSKDRADLILPAVEILYHLISFCDSPGLMFSGKGLRDGFVMEMLTDTKWKLISDCIENSVMDLLETFQQNHQHIAQMQWLYHQMLVGLQNHHFFPTTPEQRFLLKQATTLFYLGEYLGRSEKSQHTFYILSNTVMFGLTHKEKIMIAAIASYKNFSTLKQYLQPFLEWFSKEEISWIREHGSLLKFCYSLNVTKRNVVKEIQILKEYDKIVVKGYCIKGYLAEQQQIEKQRRHLEKVLQLPINVIFQLL